MVTVVSIQGAIHYLCAAHRYKGLSEEMFSLSDHFNITIAKYTKQLLSLTYVFAEPNTLLGSLF